MTRNGQTALGKVLKLELVLELELEL